MLFSNTVFLLLFFPLLIAVYYNPLAKGRTYRNIVLTIFSLLFYAYGESIYVLLMMVSITITWIGGMAMDIKGGT